MTTTTLETPTKSRPSLADELHRVADWIREHDVAQEVMLIVFPSQSQPNKPFRVVLDRVDTLSLLFPGEKATRTKRGNSVEFRITRDEITFDATKYVSGEAMPVVEEITL